MAGRVVRSVLILLLFAASGLVPAQNLPADFRRTDPIVARTQPTGVYFSHDGRVFVTEKSGQIWVYQNLLDSSPHLLVDLGANVHNFWDRGLLGFALDPHFPEVPYVYVQYGYNGGLGLGGPVPRWPSTSCPTPPGATTNGGGCVISGRISRLTVGGNVANGEQVLVEDWYQQFPSHSIGTIAFGPDGYLYAGGGDGASFNGHDYGQWGNPQYPDERSPLNPSNPGDPATNQGGSLRSQGLEIRAQYNAAGHDVWLDGSIIRIDPASVNGEGAPGNPLDSDPWPNARRIIAYGLRNPFRFTFRPGSGGEVWVGDVGEGTWEEIDRIPALPAAGGASLVNFGWPCFEGRPGPNHIHHPGFDATPICIALYSGGDSGGFTPQTPPWYTYVHQGSGSDITGLAFYTGTSYPAAYQNSLFFADNSRTVIFNIPFVDANHDGIPDPPADSTAAAFYGGASATAVQLATGPGGDLFFANLNTGRISRISYCAGGCTNRAPSAAIALAAGSTAAGAPRTIAFSASNSIDPDADGLAYAWDLDGDGAFDDASGVSASAFYGANGPHEVAVRVDDGHGGADIARMRVEVTNTAPSVTITSPAASLLWASGDAIALTATSSDAQQGTLPDAALAWQVFREDCTNDDFTGCSETLLGAFSGSSTQVVAPDASFPAYLRIVLTGTDNGGLTATAQVAIYPATAALTLASAPAGLALVFDGSSAIAPHTHTVIVNAGFTVGAPTPQALSATWYDFVMWSDGGAATHVAHLASTAPATLTATFAAPADIAVALDDGLAVVNTGQTVTWTLGVDNPGANALAGVGIGASLPAGLLDAHWTCIASAGSTCAAGGSGAPLDSAYLASAGHLSYAIEATVADDAVGPLTVAASASVPAGYVNLSPGNDSASDTDAVFADVILRDGFERAH